ncbi:MAG: NAD-glutamate dehydrogenase [Ahrensia sp.]|nr:NAD-glutamate dehydrogenase [Ahrensia sp.]
MAKAAGKEVKTIIAAVRAALPENRKNTVGALATDLFAAAVTDDLKAQPTQALTNILVAAYDALSDRKSRILKVEALGDDQTLITAVMANRAFILDSILAELSRHDIDARLVLHPLIDRDKRGLASLVQIVLDETTAQRRKQLQRDLKYVLDQVVVVTEDWQDMLARIGRIIVEFRTNPPPAPAADIAEAIQFLEWICDNNFTLLGLREFEYRGDQKSGTLEPLKEGAMGILRDPDLMLMARGGKPMMLTPEIRAFLFRPDPLIITKANVRSSVHRRTHLDYIGVKRYTPDGQLAGELRIAGLFTSTAYTKSVLTIPVLRHKAQAVLDSIEADPSSHTGKSLINILENWPRDEMFQISAKRLTDFAIIASALDERPRIRVLVRPDKFDRFVSIIVFVPRDRYDTDVRRRIGAYFAQAFDGYLSTFFPSFLENGLTRVHFIIGRSKGRTPNIERSVLEAEVTEITRTWDDRLLQANGGIEPDYAFSLAYQDQMTPSSAVTDMALMDRLEDESQLSVDFHDSKDGEDCARISLKLFHLNQAVPLSQRVPMLENLGFRVIEESTFELERSDGEQLFLHDMQLEADGDSDAIWGRKPELEETLHAVWSGRVDNDAFNALVLKASFHWREAAAFRAYARYLRQIRSRFTAESMADALARHADVARKLADLFCARFDPAQKKRDERVGALEAEINAALEAITSSEDDRILRDFLNVIQATLRSNYFCPLLEQDGVGGSPAPVLAFKFDPSAISIMPQPVPHREIFVSSPRVEGTHIRFGPVARGGLRWSDRAQDYRTEVLGLVKAQQVKNAVIVPVGSKGGFLPRQLPVGGDRDAVFQEGREAYRIFISSLLSLTDNLVEGEVKPPAKTVRHDGDDPYFVVAADKGTATFSDTANAISQDYDFWLDDAFASGGSAGYDHKAMGITARGAWEAVKRHFREMDRDIQAEPFTAAGVGDMSGDVFGNGMLLSPKTRLIAAFDHRDIFIDPDPDIEASFKERKRIFDKGRSSWQDYNSDVISKGGGIFSRGAKKITLSKAAAEAIGFEAGTHTPQEVMSAIMRAPVDLMWFGGIGTYIRASHESNADADDRANDAIRVTAKEVRAKVIGEGANLGVTQPGRIEFGQHGGRCNSDAIDNSAGVNSSDVEVNIKIALAAAMKSGKLSRKRRDTLLESMTEDVADLVLRNNYLQTLSISLSQRRGMEAFVHQHRLMQWLESRGRLDRDVEDLPDDIEMAERQAAGRTLVRPEIGVLLAYAKIVALDDLVDTDVPDDPYFRDMLVSYFPPKMQKAYANQIEGHRLRREIIATVLANSLVNRGGPTFLSRVSDRTGAAISTVARAYATVRDVFQLPAINASIDALDTNISGDLQLELYDIVQERVLSQTVWFVRYEDFSGGIESAVKAYRGAVQKLSDGIETVAPDFLGERVMADRDRFVDGGVPQNTALALARMQITGLVPDILFAARQTKADLSKAATVFFAVTEAFRIGRIMQAARQLETNDYYDNLALDRALQSLHKARRDITIEILAGESSTQDWLKRNDAAVSRTRNQMRGIVESEQATVSRLTVAANLLGDLARE